MHRARLVLSHVTKRYGGVEALKEASIEVGQGEIVGLLGPNGAGKSTALKLAVGLLRPDEGEVLLDGRRIDAKDLNLEAEVGYLPDEPLLYPKLTGWETLDLFAALRGIEPARVTQALEDTDDALRLEDDALSRFTGTYSFGMKRKLLILLASVHQPSVYILDEPTLGLDVLAIEALKSDLRGLRNRGCAVLIATNDLSLAASVSDRVSLINAGVVRFTGSRAEIRERYPEELRESERIFLDQVVGDDRSEPAG